MARQFFKRGTDVFELGEQGERKLELPEFKSLGLNFDFLKEGQPISLNEGITGNAGQMINEELVRGGQDPFNLEGQSTDQLSQILNTIQSQISQGNQNQTSALDILKQSREAAGIPGLTEKLAGVQSLIGQRETGFEQASNILSEQLAPQPFITGQQAALERRKQTELAGLQRQEQVLESQLGRAETGARFEAGLVVDELKELRDRPKELIDLVSKAFGLQADVAGERRAEAQEKRAVEKALRDAKAENRPKFEQVGDTLLRLDPDGTVTPVFTSPKKAGDESGEIDSFARRVNSGEIKLSNVPSKIRGQVSIKAKEFVGEELREEITVGQTQGFNREQIIDSLVPAYPEFSKKEIRDQVFDLIPDKPQEDQPEKQGTFGGFFSRLFSF